MKNNNHHGKPLIGDRDKVTPFNEFEIEFVKIALNELVRYAKIHWTDPNLNSLSRDFIRRAQAIISKEFAIPVKYFEYGEFLAYQSYIGFGNKDDLQRFDLIANIKRLIQGEYRLANEDALISKKYEYKEMFFENDKA